MIALTFALPQESKDFVAALDQRGTESTGSLPVLLGSMASREIVVAHTGVGPVSAAHRIGRLLSRHRPKTLVCTGFAGALSPALRIGDIVVAENFSGPDLLDKAVASGSGNVFRGVLTSQFHTVETPEAKRLLANETGAIAVDMETRSVFDACIRAGIPMLSIRAISDTATQALPVPFAIWFDADKQQPRVLALVRHLIFHPALIPDFCKFVSGINIARRNLTRQLMQLVPKL